MSESIHVPSAQVKRWKALLKLFVPIVAVAAGTAWTTTVTWFKTRPSADDVAKLTGDCTAVAKQAEDLGKTNHVQIFALQNTSLELARTAIALHAQAEVVRAYFGSKRLPEYIERASRFYEAAFERELDAHPGEVVRALKLARAAVWRPDRD